MEQSWDSLLTQIHQASTRTDLTPQIIEQEVAAVDLILAKLSQGLQVKQLSRKQFGLIESLESEHAERLQRLHDELESKKLSQKLDGILRNP